MDISTLFLHLLLKIERFFLLRKKIAKFDVNATDLFLKPNGLYFFRFCSNKILNKNKQINQINWLFLFEF